MSTTPPGEGPPIPPGYQPGDYIPFKDRDPHNPTSIAGQWADPARQAQQSGQLGDGRKMTAEERYRAIYGVDAPYRISYASWGRRVLGALIDGFLGIVAAIPFYVGYAMVLRDLDLRTDAYGNRVRNDWSHVSAAAAGLCILGLLISLAFGIYNTLIRQGRTGYTLGKTVVGIRLVHDSTNEPIGALLCFVRQLAHIVDGLICYLGWLWPLWDPKSQTLADKIMGTVVVIQSADELG